MLRGNGVDVDAADREEWEWPEHGGSFARAIEHPVR
jgi:uronate dehydrogenase